MFSKLFCKICLIFFFSQNCCVFTVIFATRKKKKTLGLTNPSWQVRLPVKQVFFFWPNVEETDFDHDVFIEVCYDDEPYIFMLYKVRIQCIVGTPVILCGSPSFMPDSSSLDISIRGLCWLSLKICLFLFRLFKTSLFLLRIKRIILICLICIFLVTSWKYNNNLLMSYLILLQFWTIVCFLRGNI